MADNETDLLLAFRELAPMLDKWGSQVDSLLIERALGDIGDAVKIAPSYRRKDEKSFIFKSLYRKKQYNNPLLDIEDKVATRIVVLKSTDIKLVEDRIKNSEFWDFKVSKEIHREIEDKPQLFDYQSFHMIVWPNDKCEKFLPDQKPFLSCEIQVRTLLQHAFAEISHDSTYKGPYKNDKSIIRHMAKSMALMEATDDYFCKIFEIMSDETKAFSNWLTELTEQFREFRPDFDKASIDLPLTDLVFELLLEKPVDINDLKAFVQKHNGRIAAIIKNVKNSLVSQPVFLLIFYYLINHRTFLIENWPLNHESLKLVFFSAGESFDNY